MNYNDNDIEVAASHGRDRYRVTVGDLADIDATSAETFLYIRRDYGKLDTLEAAQLAGALVAMETLTATNEHQAMNALTIALETMNDVREKAGNAPLADVDEILDDRTDQEHVRDFIKKIRKGQP